MAERKSADQIVLELRTAGRLNASARITYRCTNGCHLARIITTPQGIVIVVPPYHLPHGINEKLSTTQGRENHTRDGDRSWLEQDFYITQAVNIPIHCDHLLDFYLPVERVKKDLSGRQKIIVLHDEDIVTSTDIKETESSDW